MSEFPVLVRTGRISGNTFQHREVTFEVRGDLAVFEGDIIVGRVSEIEKVSAQPEMKTLVPEGIAIKGSQFRWSGARIPFHIHPGLLNPQRVRDAIKHWETNTPIRFLELTNATLNQNPDRVLFTPGGDCSSDIGKRGGEQLVLLASDCKTGNVIHEIGHAVGLWHEQSREDRNDFIEILRDNIEGSALHNFTQHVSDGDAIGGYDYGSIMHYPKDAFSRNGLDTIRTKNGAKIGQRDALSAGDIAAVKTIYG